MSYIANCGVHGITNNSWILIKTEFTARRLGSSIRTDVAHTDTNWHSIGTALVTKNVLLLKKARSQQFENSNHT